MLKVQQIKLQQQEIEQRATEARNRELDRQRQVAPPFAAHPSTPDNNPRVTTGGFFNGAGWRIMSADDKLIFLAAFRDGTTSALAFSTLENLRAIYPVSKTWGEVRSLIDEFYQSSENRAIPISEALMLCALKAFGVEQAVIAEDLLKWRKAANEQLERERLKALGLDK